MGGTLEAKDELAKLEEVRGAAVPLLSFSVSFLTLTPPFPSRVSLFILCIATSLCQGLVREPWMDELSLAEMTEEQRQKLEEFEEKQKQFE